MKLDHQQLGEILGKKLVSNPEFLEWITQKTQLEGLPLGDPEDDRTPWMSNAAGDRPSDVLVTANIGKTALRVGVHIRNQVRTAKTDLAMAQNYPVRAKQMMEKKGYHAFATILVAMKQFEVENPEICALFDRICYHDQVAQFVDEYADDL